MVSDRAFVFHMHVPFDNTLYWNRKTLGFDDDGHLWNWRRTGAFVFQHILFKLRMSWYEEFMTHIKI
jgi:hypothetical protein